MSITSRIRLTLADFRADCRGLGATEFALILPIMLLLFFGMVEISNGVSVDRKVSLLSRTLSDLTSRATSVSSVDVSNFFTIGGAMLQPYSDQPLKAIVSEVYIDPATSAARVIWSQSSPGASIRGAGTAVPVPAGLISKDSTGKVLPNQYLIFSEVSYDYVPVVGYVMGKAGVTLSDQTFMRPRQSFCVYNPPPSSSNLTPPCPTS